MNITAILALSALALVACSDDSKGAEAVGDAGSLPGVTPTSDASTPLIPAETPDGGTPAIPLILWVDDLVDHHTTDDSAPDTVDDKNISDDENPSQFDARFQ